MKIESIFLRIMKITTFLLSICVFSTFAANVNSQNARVKIKANGITISQFISQIESQTEYLFVYSKNEINTNERVNVKSGNKTVAQCLEEAFQGSEIKYTFENNYIVLKKKYTSPRPATASPSQQQPKRTKLTGKVTDGSTGEPIPGASILVSGSTRGVISDVDGTFSIDVASSDKLVISFLGMQTQTIAVGGQKTLSVKLMPQTSELNEVTVVAYAKQKKQSVIGSITTIKPAELKVPSSNLTTALAGRIAGIISYQRSGEPGADNAQFFIRGVTTFGYKKDPLILLDNNEISSTELARLQTDDIASFSIMKDATATSLYGSRGANGVILITSKEGMEGKVKVNVRVEESMSQPTKQISLASPITYMQDSNEAILTRNPLGDQPYSQLKIDNTIAGGNRFVYPQTDWYDMLFKNYAMNTRVNFNVSGGGKVARYYMAGSFTQDNGVLKVDKRASFNNNIDLKRYMLRANINLNITKTTEATIRLSGTFDDYNGPIPSGTELYNEVMNTNPVLFPAYYEPDEANKYVKHILFGNADTGEYHNPYADMLKGYRENSTAIMLAQFELRQDLSFITKGLSLRAMANTNRYSYFDLSRQYKPFFYKVGNYDKVKDQYKLVTINENTGTETLDYSPGSKSVYFTNYFEAAADYTRRFDKHNVSALLVYTQREYKTSDASSLQLSLPSRNISLAGRVTYDYDDRYFIEGNFGYNGSERFSKNHRFGFFPSIGCGWYISDEPFWKQNIKKIISKLKLKLTYGLVGNDAIGSASDRFLYISEVNMQDADRAVGFGTYANNSRNGITVNRYANSDITWETAAKTNLGIELGLLNDLDVQVDIFRERRYNILQTRSAIPTTMGLSADVMANIGKAKSHGIDISVNYNHTFNKDAWMTGMANFTYATSKYTFYEEPNYDSTPWKYHKGKSLNAVYGLIAERLFVDDSEVKNSPTQFGSEVRGGDIKYKDLNNDGKITSLDYAPIGWPSSPEINYGFGLSGGYKSFDLSFFFQGLARESFWITPSSIAPFISNQSALLEKIANDHWTEANQNVHAFWPRYNYEQSTNNNQVSSWWMRDGSFLRLKSVEFGYSLPRNLSKRCNLDNVRLYFSGTNLLTFSKFKLWDPEMGGNGLGYPVQRVYNIGFQISF